MFYNARWYDPALGRFAQADSIVPPGVQGLDRYAYVNNSPMNYVDPSGHFTCSDDPNNDDYCPNHSPSGNGNGGGGGGDDEDGENIDFSSSEDIIDDIINSDCFNGNFSSASCLGDIAYFADNLGLLIASGEMIVTDTIGVLIIAALCEAGLGGCAVGIGAAGILDLYVAGGNPLAGVENVLGAIAFSTTALADVITGDTKGFQVDSSGIHFYVSQDTLVSFGTMIVGRVPEANVDFLASGVQLNYDNARRDGSISNATYDLLGPHPNIWGCGSPVITC